MKLVYGPNKNDVVGYSDAGCPKVPIDDPRSITGTVFLSCGGPISWTTSKQSTVCSSTEAEFYAYAYDYALLATTKEAIWLHDLCLELGAN